MDYLPTNPALQRITGKKQKQESNPSTKLKEDSHKNRMPTLTTKIKGSNNYFYLISLNINGLMSTQGGWSLRDRKGIHSDRGK
jgi:hypothetical protein